MGLVTVNDLPFWHQQGLKLLEYAPLALTYLNTHPNGWLDKQLTKLSNKIFRDGAATFPLVAEEMKDVITSKPGRCLEPITAAQAYYDAVRDPSKPAANEIQVQYIGEAEPITMHLRKSVKDRDTGFRGAIYNDGAGHSIVFFCGMDIGVSKNLHDFEAIVQAKMKPGVNQQVAPAEELYMQAIKESDTVEIVGYSLGSMLANDLAARHGAQATVLADIGLPNRHGLYTAEQLARVQENVVSLRLSSDKFTEKAGNVYGRVVELPSVSGAEIKAQLGRTEIFNENSVVLAHDPKAYVLASAKVEPAVVMGPIPKIKDVGYKDNVWDALGDLIFSKAANDAPPEFAAG